MENKELRNEKIRKTIMMTLNLVGGNILFIGFWYLIVDGLLENDLANIFWNMNPSFYYILVDYKNIFFISLVIINSAFILYRHISKETDNKEAIYQAIDSINSDDDPVKLPESELRFSKKIDEIKYGYLLNKKIMQEEEQKKNDLIVYMAHDLKTPLTSLIGYLSLLQDEKEISKATQDKYINIALDKALRLEELTNEFFEITRYNLYKQEVVYRKLDMNLLFDQLVEECYPMLKEKDLECHISGTQGIYYYGDGQMLARAFDNLMKNAISYSYEHSSIDITIKNEDDLQIIFKNKGDKIPQYKLDKIFDKFYRVDPSRNSSTGGTGLGLAITKEIIELHHGTIKVKNDDENIEFIIDFPKQSTLKQGS